MLMSKMALSDQLRKIIAECGMSRYAIHKATGTNQSTLSRFVRGQCWLSAKSFDSIGELLGLRIVATVKARKGRR